MADVIILPVVRIETGPGESREVDYLCDRPADLPAAVTDINAFRYWRERRAVERREMTSLLPPADCGDL